MSDTHFVKINEHKDKLLSLGIDKNIFVTGSLSNDNYIEKFNKNFFVDKPFILITFHSVTNSKNINDNNVQNLLNSLKNLKNINFYLLQVIMMMEVKKLIWQLKILLILIKIQFLF